MMPHEHAVSVPIMLLPFFLTVPRAASGRLSRKMVGRQLLDGAAAMQAGTTASVRAIFFENHFDRFEQNDDVIEQ